MDESGLCDFESLLLRRLEKQLARIEKRELRRRGLYEPVNWHPPMRAVDQGGIAIGGLGKAAKGAIEQVLVS